MRLRPRTLYAKLTLLTVFILLVGYALMGQALYAQFSTLSHTQQYSFINTSGQQVTSAINTFAARYEWIAESLGSDTDIMAFLSTRHSKNQLPYNLFVQYKNIQTRFEQTFSSEPALLSMFLTKDDPNLLEDGTYVLRMPPELADRVADIPTGDSVWMPLDGELLLVNAVYTSDKGFVVLSVRERALYESVGIQSDASYAYYVADAQGRVLSSSDRDLLGALLPDALQGSVGPETVIEQIGNILYYRAQVGNLSVWVAYDTSDRQSVNRRSMIGLMLLVALAMLASIAALTLRGRAFSQNIRKILQKLSRMGQGAFSQTPTLHTKDELERIDREVCILGNRVVELNADLMAAAQRQKTMELRFLQMQINRHFLQNSLSSLRWMAVRNDQEEMADLMESLIAFYKVTLSQDDILTLGDELRLVEHYVRLENVIHLGDLRFHCDVPEPLLDIRVCKMTLQPFVENAIHHGKIQRMPLDIWITVEELVGGVLLHIEDNGQGMTEQRAEELRKMLQGERAGGDSIAIYNTLARLRELYGHDVDISIMVRQGTVVEILLPLKEA